MRNGFMKGTTMKIDNDVKESLDLLYDLQILNKKTRDEAIELFKNDVDNSILAILNKEEDK